VENATPADHGGLERAHLPTVLPRTMLFHYQTRTTLNGEAVRNLYMPLEDAPRNQASPKCMFVEELQTTVDAPSRHALLRLSVHDLSRVHQPVRIQCALDASHHVDCIETKFLLQ